MRFQFTAHRVSLLLCAGTLGCLLLSSSHVLAKQPFDNRDLYGKFRFNLVEVRMVSGSVEYCDEWGVLVFDGAGHATGRSTRRCNGVTDSGSGNFTYRVNPNGTFLITAVGEIESDHGQIVDRGDMLLLDGDNSNG